MYKFILTQWIMRNIDEVKVRSYVSMWITEEQANEIIATPQVAE